MGMNRVFIYTADGKESQVWVNFRASLNFLDWPDMILEERHNARLVIDKNKDIMDRERVYVLFDEESEVSLFLLRYS